MAKGYRAGRLAEEIRKITGNMLLFELKDPRLKGKMVSVSGVDVSDDGSYATVYLSVLGKSISDGADEKEKDDILKAMKSASGVIRREIGKNVKLRHVPELSFKIDNSIEYGRHMSKIIDSLGIDKYDNNDDSEERSE
ncbi:MAG: 30S ribosome-binding factor RbfA [Firmicutes bacterium]|nr:30S ribosome-binding factor RbfA [Bacillota bacterium]MDD7735081.1 30S ribosome-binding factor RbfA [Bacillota bacterium]